MLCLNTSSSYTHIYNNTNRCWVGGLAIFLIFGRQLLPIQALCLFCLNTSSSYTHIYKNTHLHTQCWVGGLAIFLIFGRQLLSIQVLCLLCLKTSSSYTNIIVHNTSSTLSARNSAIVINNNEKLVIYTYIYKRRAETGKAALEYLVRQLTIGHLKIHTKMTLKAQYYKDSVLHILLFKLVEN